MKTLRSIIFAVALMGTSLLFSNQTKADDIFKGMRGPTNFQIDQKLGYSKNERSVETSSSTTVLKYWDGSSFGKWGFMSIPYKYSETLSSSSKGLGDITFGMGPRTTIKNLHWFGYAALTFPTGDDKTKPQLGTGRLDIKLGSLVTILNKNKSLEIDGMTEYSLTENTPRDIPNEIYIGVVGGGKLTEKIRAVIGLTKLIRDKDFITNLRLVGRYTLSKKLHFEIVGDRTLSHNNMPSMTNISFYTRYNLPK